MKTVDQKPQWGIIEVAGLKFADSNLGIDEANPYGKLYTWEDAMEACPKGWRLPTKEEWVRFFINITHEWVVDKEAINGMKFTDKVTGSSIFLPAMGWNIPHENDNIRGIDYYGWYWSSTRHSDMYYSCSLYFTNYGLETPNHHYCHSCGFSVRCVQDIENEK